MKLRNAFIYILVLFLAISCKEKQKEAGESASVKNEQGSIVVNLTKAQMDQAGIVLGKVKDTILNEEILANGMIDVPPQNFATVSAPMGGYIRSTQVLPGMEVDKGQVLATMEHQDFIQLQQDYLQALSRLQLTESENVRQSALFKGNASSSKKMQSSTADFESTRALVRSLEEKLKLLGLQPAKVKEGNISPQIVIRSPIHGNVKSVNATIGKFMNPSDVMYEIVDNSHQHLELKVFEKDILKVTEDQKIFFTIPTIGKEKFEGSVYLVGKSIDNTSRTITIHGHLEKEDKERLLPGMYVNAVIIAGKKMTTVVPQEAVILEKNEDYIFRKIASDSIGADFEKVKIKTGLRTRDWVEVQDGPFDFKKDSNLVMQGVYYLNSKINNVGEEE